MRACVKNSNRIVCVCFYMHCATYKWSSYCSLHMHPRILQMHSINPVTILHSYRRMHAHMRYSPTGMSTCECPNPDVKEAGSHPKRWRPWFFTAPHLLAHGRSCRRKLSVCAHIHIQVHLWRTSVNLLLCISCLYLYPNNLLISSLHISLQHCLVLCS